MTDASCQMHDVTWKCQMQVPDAGCHLVECQMQVTDVGCHLVECQMKVTDAGCRFGRMLSRPGCNF